MSSVDFSNTFMKSLNPPPSSFLVSYLEICLKMADVEFLFFVRMLRKSFFFLTFHLKQGINTTNGSLGVEENEETLMRRKDNKRTRLGKIEDSDRRCI